MTKENNARGREIKFRAWDVREKRMLTQDEMNEVGGFYYSYGVDPDPSEFILMQYTGRKDRNGREICEGDIVKIIKKTWVGVREVYWEKAKLRWYPTLIRYNDKGIFSIEIIGNIYQNPELMKKS